VDQIKIHLPKGSSGYVVIPRPPGNQKAYVDGEKTSMETYLDVMPAVYVHNNSQVQVKEKPFYPLIGFIVSVVSLFVLIAVFFLIRRKKRF
jgi:hypothetical protein